MQEQKLINEQLIKNMLWTFLVFAFILVIFDLMIYNQVKNVLYTEIDTQLTSINVNKPISKINPRMIYILRDSQGNVTNKSSIGRIYEEYLVTLNFDKTIVDKIYNINISNEYAYRGITYNVLTNVFTGQTGYLQLLVNVDGEIQTLKNLSTMLFLASIIIIVISIIASYILSRRTLKPIIESWHKQTEFVQNASHELRTPITIIQVKQQLLLQEPDSKIIDKSEDINLVIKESRRLTKLIKELMMLATADSNQLILKKDMVNVDQIISDVVAPYVDFASIENKELKLDLNFGKEYNLDRDKISELLIILLDNAIKYTSNNESILVKTYSKDNRLYIEVNDTGIGISDENKKHIFERFYREDKARSRETGGTGLGLSIAYTIVKLHGGTIKVLNNQPKGTSFVIKI